jgi:predicted lysophospholipase L1 biosynthesis ABC-type transport system permease subunit
MIRTVALASPLIWFANHVAQFALAPLACVWHSNVVLWSVAAAALLVDAGCGVVAWSAWQKRAGEDTAPMPPWLALSGVILSAGFFVVIAAQTIPILMLAGCE